jgi:hypothetical protein
MEVLGILAVVAVAVAALAISLHLKAKRRAAFQAFALQHGLEYAQGDPFGLLGWPFDLLRRGDGRGIDHVVWGNWRKTAVQAFDYWYYTETTDSKGHRSRSYRRFSCVVIEVPAAFPHLTMAREGVFTRLADHLGMEDIEFESPEFNRRYNVKARDRKFAYVLIDGRMLEWLVGFDQGWAFEVMGNRVLAYGPRVKPSGLLGLIGTAVMFRERIPSVAWSLYPVTGAP